MMKFRYFYEKKDGTIPRRSIAHLSRDSKSKYFLCGDAIPDFFELYTAPLPGFSLCDRCKAARKDMELRQKRKQQFEELEKEKERVRTFWER